MVKTLSCSVDVSLMKSGALKSRSDFILCENVWFNTRISFFVRTFGSIPGPLITVLLNIHLTRSCQTASSFPSDRTPLAGYCVVDMINRTVHQLLEILECFPVDGQ